MVVKYGPHGKFLACPGLECKNTKPYLEKIGVPCPKCAEAGSTQRRQRRGRLYYGCEANPDCDFMSWQKPSILKCPKCGSYMVKKEINFSVQ